jgi:hypothetical protein
MAALLLLCADRLARNLTPESRLLAEIRLACSRDNVRLFRFQSGNFETVDGRRIISGFPGVSDLIGWRTEYVAGQRFARFVAIEVKPPRGRVTDEQAAFLRAVAAAGGVAGVARTVDDAIALLR